MAKDLDFFAQTSTPFLTKVPSSAAFASDSNFAVKRNRLAA